MKGSIIDHKKTFLFRGKGIFMLFSLSLFIPLLAQRPVQQRDQLEREIALSEQLLQESQGLEKEALGKLKLLNRQVQLRKKLIRDTETQIVRQSDKIVELKAITRQLSQDVKEMSLTYSRLAQMTQRSFNSQNFWLMLLSSRSFTDAYYRIAYFRQFSRYRKRQIEAINKTEIYLSQKVAQLKENNIKSEDLISQKKEENEGLKGSVAKQAKLLKKVESQSRLIQNQLAVRKNKLKKLIKKDQNTFLLNPGRVDNAYAENFRKRKGLLPWPVPPENVVITESWGEDEDEFGNRIFNDGIQMATAQGQPVKAVYSGKVTAVTRLPMSGTVIILEHGKYRTVYANLKNTHVKKGDVVSENQILGSVRQDPRSGENYFDFLIYLIPDKFLNPAQWLLEK